MFKPTNAKLVTSEKEKKHTVKIEPNGQLIFNAPFFSDTSKVINDTDTVFSIFLVDEAEEETLIISFADELQLDDDTDYQTAKQADQDKGRKNQPDYERQKLGYCLLRKGDTKKGAKTNLLNASNKVVPKDGYRHCYTEGVGLELNHDDRYITLYLSKVEIQETSKTKNKKEEKVAKWKFNHVISSWIDKYKQDPNFVSSLSPRGLENWRNKDLQREFWDTMDSTGYSGKFPKWYMDEKRS